MKILLAAALFLFPVAGLSAQATQPLGKNILSFSPASVSEYTITGFALQWERMLGNKWSLMLPLQYSFGHSSPCDDAIRTRVAYFAPGLRWFPAGNAKRVTYSVGPTIAAGAGVTNCACGIDEMPVGTPEAASAAGFRPLTTLGMLVSNAVSVTMPNGFYMGAEAGTGYSFLNRVGGENPGGDIMLHFDLRAGFRF